MGSFATPFSHGAPRGVARRGRAKLARSQPYSGPTQQRGCPEPTGEDPLPSRWGEGAGQRPHVAGHHCLQPNSSAQPWPVVSAVTVPFQGLWPSSSRRETVHLASKTLGCRFFQMQVTDKLCGRCKTLIFKFGISLHTPKEQISYKNLSVLECSNIWPPWAPILLGTAGAGDLLFPSKG